MKSAVLLSEPGVGSDGAFSAGETPSETRGEGCPTSLPVPI